MKWFVLIAFFANVSAFANVTMNCVEFSPEAIDNEMGATVFSEATQKLRAGVDVSSVSFKVIVPNQVKGCVEVVEEQDLIGNTTVMGLDAGVSNENCVYTNKGSNYVYGWVCKR